MSKPVDPIDVLGRNADDDKQLTPVLDSQGATLAVGDEVAYNRSNLADAGLVPRRTPGPATGRVTGFTDRGAVWVGIDTFPHEASKLTRTGRRLDDR